MKKTVLQLIVIAGVLLTTPIKAHEPTCAECKSICRIERAQKKKQRAEERVEKAKERLEKALEKAEEAQKELRDE